MRFLRLDGLMTKLGVPGELSGPLPAAGGDGGALPGRHRGGPDGRSG